MVAHFNPKTSAYQRVSYAILRQKFNDALIWERVATGEFKKIIVFRGPPLSKDEPPGTESIMYSIRTGEDFEIARAHVYLRPDQTLGGSGKPDPKIVYDETENMLFMQIKKARK